jgi:hypothetical protein
MDQQLDFIITTIKEKLALGQTLQDAEFALRNVFGKELVEKALTLVKEQDPILAGEAEPVALSDQQDFLGWYQGPRTHASAHWSLLRDHLANKEGPWTEEMIRSLDLASTSVMEHLAPPKSQKSLTSKGLVLGYIQSGKTANFSAVIAKAVDEGYKLIVVLSGMHNNLRLQTQARLTEELVNPKPEACTTLTRIDEKGDFDRRQSVTANRALGSKDGFTLVVLKKNTHVLRSFNNWIEKASAETLKGCPTLIIDDESDQASVNTKEPDQDPTAINGHIRKLLGHFEVKSYIGYTATPFANVLINGDTEEDIYPRNFLICLEKPPTYFGPEELFGRMGIDGDDEKKPLPVTRIIPELEDNMVDGEEVIPDSLKTAIKSYILSATLRLFRGQRDQHIMMLVHTSHLIAEHDKVHVWVKDYLEKLQLDFDSLSELPDDFKQILIDDHFITSKFITQQDSKVDLKKFFIEVKRFVERIEIILENSKSSDRLSFERDEPLWGIVVGGNTLSRGLTLEGLTVSYFTRNSKQYDTLLQMGRWFGYRKGYVDLTRLFVSKKMKRNFYHLATVEQEIRDEINTMAANGERPIDIALRIRSFPNLNITASNKMRNARKASLTFSGSKIQFRTINTSDPNLKDKNFKALEGLLSNIHKSNAPKITPHFEEFKASHLYKNVSSEYILQFIESFHLNTDNLRFDPRLGIKYISDLNTHGELTNWSVCLMSSKTGDSFTFSTGELCYLVQRSALDSVGNDADVVTLRSLVPPGGELIDLDDILKPTEGNAVDFEKSLQKKQSTDTKIRHDLRPSDRGLLLIYPLKPLNQNEIKSESSPHLGISLIFPKSSNDLGFMNYIENESI